jgi:hypothetical protein
MHCVKRTAACVAGFVATLASIPASADPFDRIHVAVNRHEFRGRCPAEVVFTGSINFSMPHPRGFAMNYFWQRSDGAKGPVKVVHPGPNERRLVVHDKWRVGGRGEHELSETLHVNSGNTHLRESSDTVRVDCR